jgi:hypothetical protein
MAMSSKITSSASTDQLIIVLKTLFLPQKSHPLIFISNYISMLLTSLTTLTPNLLFFSFHPPDLRFSKPPNSSPNFR